MRCERCFWFHWDYWCFYRVTLVTDDEQNGCIQTLCKNCAAHLALCNPPMIQHADDFINQLIKEETEEK